MIDKRDLEKYVFYTQMEKRGCLFDDEIQGVDEFRNKLQMHPSFQSNECTEWRVHVSKAIVKRRNAAYKLAVDMLLGDDALYLERYIYDQLMKGETPEINEVQKFFNL